jgi:hypothetical protein
VSFKKWIFLFFIVLTSSQSYGAKQNSKSASSNRHESARAYGYPLLPGRPGRFRATPAPSPSAPIWRPSRRTRKGRRFIASSASSRSTNTRPLRLSRGGHRPISLAERRQKLKRPSIGGLFGVKNISHTLGVISKSAAVPVLHTPFANLGNVITGCIMRQPRIAAGALHKALRRFGLCPRPKAIHPAGHVRPVLDTVVTKHLALGD